MLLPSLFQTINVLIAHFNCLLKLLLWEEHLSAHYWTLWAVECVPWFEEMMLSGPNWHSIFCSGSFIKLWTFASTIGKAKPSLESVSILVRTHFPLWLLLFVSCPRNLCLTQGCKDILFCLCFLLEASWFWVFCLGPWSILKLPFGLTFISYFGGFLQRATDPQMLTFVWEGDAENQTGKSMPAGGAFPRCESSGAIKLDKS